MTGRFVISNVKAPNGSSNRFCTNLVRKQVVKMTLFGIQPIVKQMGPIPSIKQRIIKLNWLATMFRTMDKGQV